MRKVTVWGKRLFSTTTQQRPSQSLFVDCLLNTNLS
jgi:hypothetical protein